MVTDTTNNQDESNIVGPDIVPLLSGVLAACVACAITLAEGLAAGWEPWRVAIYVVVALLFVLLVSLPGLNVVWARWLCESGWWFLALGGALGFALQAISGSPSAQPIVFTVIFVHATLLLQGARFRSLAIGALYPGLIVLGLWVYGWRDPAVLLTSVFIYTAVFGFMYAFTSLSITQAAARWRADELASELAQERDYQVRLAAVNATLARELDLHAVLGQVSAAAHSLAQPEQVRVWLCEAGEPPRLAARYPLDSEPTDVSGLSEPHSASETLVLPLQFGGVDIGMLELCGRSTKQFAADDATRLEPFANAAAVAIRNAQLYQQSQLSATLVERNRLARELHDTIAQGLTAIAMQLEAAQRSLDRDSVRTRARLERATDLTRATLDDVRRSVWTLASPLVEGADFGAALAQLCEQFQERTGIATHYTHHGPAPSISSAAASQLLRIAQEALHNAEKHAHAHHATVCTTVENGMMRLVISDDGIGFDPQTANGGFGLISLRERARLVGGELRVESAVGAGTRVLVAVGITNGK